MSGQSMSALLIFHNARCCRPLSWRWLPQGQQSRPLAPKSNNTDRVRGKPAGSRTILSLASVFCLRRSRQITCQRSTVFLVSDGGEKKILPRAASVGSVSLSLPCQYHTCRSRPLHTVGISACAAHGSRMQTKEVDDEHRSGYERCTSRREFLAGTV